MTSSRVDIEDGIIQWFDGPEWDEVVLAVFEDKASGVEASAKANAPWEDITGNARAGLRARAINEDGVVSLILEHTVEYGFWLEVLQNGRFAILQRTMEENAKSIMDEAVRAIADARSGSML